MSRERRRATRPPWKGFTLLELIVVITIIGILGTFVTVRVIPLISNANRKKIDNDLQTIIRAAEIIQALKGRLPAALDELVNARDDEGRPIGGLKEMPLDPWKRPYLYAVEDDGPVATCLGRDGSEGGEGEDADIRWPAKP